MIDVHLLFRFQLHTTEAAKLEAELTKAQNTITAAEQLISQLDGEHTRWNSQVGLSLSVFFLSISVTLHSVCLSVYPIISYENNKMCAKGKETNIGMYPAVFLFVSVFLQVVFISFLCLNSNTQTRSLSLLCQSKLTIYYIYYLHPVSVTQIHFISS